jgi:CubicO group peptidase (beta-lactamase class C family)
MNLALIVFLFLASGVAFDLSAQQQKPEAGNSATAPAPTVGDPAKDDWKTWLDNKAEGFSGVALIARGDAIQTVSVHGLADRSTGRRNTAETRFNLGSINKTFTAVAVAQLIQQGRLSLDDTLAKFIPDYPDREAARDHRSRPAHPSQRHRAIRAHRFRRCENGRRDDKSRGLAAAGVRARRAPGVQQWRVRRPRPHCRSGLRPELRVLCVGTHLPARRDDEQRLPRERGA